MGIPSHIAAQLDRIPALTPENFLEHLPLMNGFWKAAGMSWVTVEAATTLSAAQQKLDDEGTFLLFSKVDPEYRKLIEKIESTHGRWWELQKSFLTVTFTDRLIVFDKLINVAHNPGLHISKYTSEVQMFAKDLKAMGMMIPDDILTSILLVRLDSVMAKSKKSLCREAKFPDFDTAAAQLRADAHDDSNDDEMRVKTEIAMAAFNGNRLPRPPQGTPPAEAFDGGFRWCSPASDHDCFRCGREGHRAQVCMAVMPESVVQWILGSTHSAGKSKVSVAPSPLQAHAAATVADENYVDESDRIPWELLTLDQVRSFNERGLYSGLQPLKI